jgi:hypothetical protein
VSCPLSLSISCLYVFPNQTSAMLIDKESPSQRGSPLAFRCSTSFLNKCPGLIREQAPHFRIWNAKAFISSTGPWSQERSGCKARTIRARFGPNIGSVLRKRLATAGRHCCFGSAQKQSAVRNTVVKPKIARSLAIALRKNRNEETSTLSKLCPRVLFTTCIASVCSDFGTKSGNCKNVICSVLD